MAFGFSCKKVIFANCKIFNRMRQRWNKLFRTSFVPMVALVLSACHADFECQVNCPQKVGIYAGGAETRTQMLPNGLSTEWVAGDELAVWARNSSGEFTLSNQIFKTYGLDGARGFFTSELAESMSKDDYTYYCTYPVPVSVNGTSVTFSLPAVQDGKVTGGSDIMIADPVLHGALTPVPDPEDHTGMRMSMNRMMHQFRFYIPEDNSVIGEEELQKIMLTFPSDVAGKVTYDLADMDAAPALSESTGSMELELAEPLGISGATPEYACLAIVPASFSEGDSLQVKAYTEDKIAYFAPIGLKARTFEAGHSTPVKLNVSELKEFAGILTFTLSVNNLGENPNVITFKAPEGCNFGDGGSNVYVYAPGREIQVGETISFKFEEDVQAYTAFSGKQIDVSYDSEHAVMNETITMPAITQSGKTDASLTVPYLLYQDFSGILKEGESYGNNSYASDERKQPGVSLDGIMPENGWNAARFWMKPAGGAVRINMRYQMVKVFLSFTTSHYGRLDTPPLAALKDGAVANLMVTFDAGAHVNPSSNDDAEKGNLTYISLTTHENASNPINGVGTGTGESGKLEDFGIQYYKSAAMPNAYGADDFLNTYPTHVVKGVEATKATRLCFYPSTAFIKEGLGINAEFNVYIDNIKVQIDN